MKLFLFAIGGTGARVVRSLTMMLASGIQGLDSSIEIVPIIIDRDEENGDKTRAIDLLKCYRNIHKRLYNDTQEHNDDFFMTRITALNHVGIANPNDPPAFDFKFGVNGQQGNSQTFSEYLDMQSFNRGDVNIDLLEALFDDSDPKSPSAELYLDLEKGFKGNPNIGSVVFHELRQKDEFQRFLGAIHSGSQRDCVFVVSSIFGGTGASGAPEIINAIRDSQNNEVNNAKIGSALVLPYFDLNKTKNDNDDTLAVDHTTFNAKTRAALEYYAEPNGYNDRVDALYYVGDTNHDTYAYHEGKDKQKNDAHVVEFVAASAIVDFLLKVKRNQLNGRNTYEFGIQDEKKGSAIHLPDFYNDDTSVSHVRILDSLSAFSIAMKFYRDVVWGDREEDDNTDYYKVYKLAEEKQNGNLFTFINIFLGANNSNNYGYYSWLEELSNHQHKLDLFRMNPGNDLTYILSHGIIKDWINPIKDDKIKSALNKKDGSSPKEFIKALRNVAVKKYSEVKSNVKPEK